MSPNLTKNLYDKYPDLLTRNGKSILRYDFEYQDGWYNITDEYLNCVNTLFNDLKQIYKNIHVDSDFVIFKEKFGTMEIQGFHIGGIPELYNDVFWSITQFFTSKSNHTCEITGNWGSLRNEFSYVQTLCEDEYKKRLKSDIPSNGFFSDSDKYIIKFDKL